MWRHFAARGFRNLVGRTSAELDLRDAAATVEFFDDVRPEVVIDAATFIADNFIADNL